MREFIACWALVLAGTAGCDTETTPDATGSSCAGAKCDLPTGTTDELCQLRQSEVLDSTQRGFTENALRWACADVEGVTSSGGDSRGQEYCEYYAVVVPPGEEAGVPLGQILDRQGMVTPLAVCVEGDETDSCGLTLTENELFDWEDDPSAVVGACLFTTWHSDVPGPLPACEGGCGEDGQVLGVPLDEDHARMKRQLNSNGAAAGLVQDCVNLSAQGRVAQPESWDNADDPLRDPFYRGCATANDNWNTGWRRSDSSVCAVANRLVECGCEVPGVEASALGKAVVPPQPAADGSFTLRGFPMGSWEDSEALTGGCRYVTAGEDSKIVVACDLTAADVLADRGDPKERCRQIYGNQVVVHVPLPADQIECSPPDTPAAATCGTMPWNIGREG